MAVASGGEDGSEPDGLSGIAMNSRDGAPQRTHACFAPGSTIQTVQKKVGPADPVY